MILHHDRIEKDSINNSSIDVSIADNVITFVFNGRMYHKKFSVFFDTNEEFEHYTKLVKKHYKEMYAHPTTYTAYPFYKKIEQLKVLENLSKEDLINYIRRGDIHWADTTDEMFFDPSILNIAKENIYSQNSVYVYNEKMERSIKHTKSLLISGFKNIPIIDKEMFNTFLTNNKKEILNFFKKQNIEYLQSLKLHVYHVHPIDLFVPKFEIKCL